MKLFAKLFLTLGVAMTVGMVAAVTLGFYIGQLTFEQWLGVDFPEREPTINAAHAELNRGGREALTGWLRQNQTPAPGRTLYIVDSSNNDLLGRELPWAARFILNPRGWRDDRDDDRDDDGDGGRDFNDGGFDDRRDNDRDFDRRDNDRDFDRGRYSDYGSIRNRFPAQFWERLDAPNGEQFRALFQQTRITLLDILGLPATRIGVVTLAVIAAAITALLLAKSLSSPIVRLQRATRGLAAGALDTRVGAPFDRRKDEIGTLARDFDAMAEQIQTLITDKEVLIRDVSHELRSPLARIRVALALAQRKTESKAQGDLERIEQETERLDQLVGQILTLARLRTATAEHHVDVELEDLLREVVEDARFEHANVKIAFEAKPVPAVRGNAGELASAVENVLRNALIHSGSESEVGVDLEQVGREVAITIADNGPGVPEADLKRLFEPFYRVDPSRDHQTSGYGLGLAIAARIIEKHGGTVEARNRPDGGLAVTFKLPVG